MMEMLTNLVTQSGVGATQLSAILLGVLFLIMIIGLAAGQELAFVLGGAGVVIGYLAWGGPGITIAMTKVYDQMQSYSMVAIPMFVLMANFLTHSKVADGLFLSIRYLLGPLKGGLGLAVIVVSTVFAATTGIVGASVVTMGMLLVEHPKAISMVKAFINASFVIISLGRIFLFNISITCMPACLASLIRSE